MAAPKGNSYYRERYKSGRNRKVETPDQLMELAFDYFDWVEANPLKEEKAFAFQGDVTKEKVDKMRPFTMDAMCFHIGITYSTYAEWRNSREDLSEVIAIIDKIIRNQKFEGAAANMLNANIISRDLGMVDKQDLNHSNPDGNMGANVNIDITAEDMLSILDKI